MKLSDIPVERLAAWTIVLAGGIVALRFLMAPIFLTALPFLLAWTMAYFARPIALRLHRHTRLSTGVLSVAIVFLFLMLCFGLLFFAVRQAGIELLALGGRLVDDEAFLPNLLASVEQAWVGFTDRLPFLSFFGGGDALTALWQEWLPEAIRRLGEWALGAAGRLAGALPNAMIFLLVTLVAAFYFALDLGSIHRSLLQLLPEKWQQATEQVKTGAWQVSMGYLRAYLLLLLITFSLLLIGFLLLRLPYAVLLAALFSILDLLPIIGVGTLLIPWGIFVLIGGNLPLGVGLLALYAVIALVRQFTEPRLIGKQVGMHPLPTLLISYAGFKLLGFWGLMLLPGACMILRYVFIEKAPATK